MEATQSAMPTASQVVIVVVDDDVAILDALSMLLEYRGWQVVTFLSGEDFLASLDEIHPNCLILDLKLSGMNGAEVLRAMASRQAQCPTLILTARPGSALAAEAAELGAAPTLSKPVAPEALLRHVENKLGGAA